MNSDRIKEIQMTTAYPESVSVKQALLQVWNECQQENNIELTTLRQRVKDLEGYARHEEGCHYDFNLITPTNTCTCGLSDLLTPKL